MDLRTNRFLVILAQLFLYIYVDSKSNPEDLIRKSKAIFGNPILIHTSVFDGLSKTLISSHSQCRPQPLTLSKYSVGHRMRYWLISHVKGACACSKTAHMYSNWGYTAKFSFPAFPATIRWQATYDFWQTQTHMFVCTDTDANMRRHLQLFVRAYRCVCVCVQFPFPPYSTWLGWWYFGFPLSTRFSCSQKGRVISFSNVTRWLKLFLHEIIKASAASVCRIKTNYVNLPIS